MPKSAFDKAHLAAWENALESKRPKQIELPDIIGKPQAESLEVVVAGPALAIRLATREGRTVDFLINPVAARELMFMISNAGRQEGWYDEKLNIIPPDWFYDA